MIEEFDPNEIHTQADPPQKKRPKTLLLVICWLLSLVLVGTTAALCAARATTSESATIAEAAKVIRDNFYFIDDTDTNLIDGALKGMVSSLGDPYAAYFTADEYAELTKEQSGNYTGIGVMIQLQDDGTHMLSVVYDGTPAAEAGLKEGDILDTINGTSCEGLSLQDAVALVKVNDGDVNTIVVRRGEQTITCTVTAREVHTPAVSYKMLDGNIGYIYLSEFHGICVEEMQTALSALREQGMQSLILDIRDNLGGSLSDVCDIADLFLPKDQVITSLRSRNGDEVVYRTDTDGLDLPIVLLVNGYSASASELLAGALKDHDVAHLIGTKTYGKGIVQSYFYVQDTGGYIKITTQAYYTPSGVCVQEEGITPDEVVELSEEASGYSIRILPYALDTQLQAAVAYLSN